MAIGAYPQIDYWGLLSHCSFQLSCSRHVPWHPFSKEQASLSIAALLFLSLCALEQWVLKPFCKWMSVWLHVQDRRNKIAIWSGFGYEDTVGKHVGQWEINVFHCHTFLLLTTAHQKQKNLSTAEILYEELEQWSQNSVKSTGGLSIPLPVFAPVYTTLQDFPALGCDIFQSHWGTSLNS